MNFIYLAVYLAIGLMLSLYWLDTDYAEERREVSDKAIDDGMTNIFLLGLCFFWPFYLLKNIIKHRKI